MKKIRINLHVPTGDYQSSYKMQDAIFLDCEVENVVYVKNDNPEFPNEKYIAYDMKTGLGIVYAENVKALKGKVNEIRDKIEKQRSLDNYKKAIINSSLF